MSDQCVVDGVFCGGDAAALIHDYAGSQGAGSLPAGYSQVGVQTTVVSSLRRGAKRDSSSWRASHRSGQVAEVEAGKTAQQRGASDVAIAPTINQSQQAKTSQT